MALLPLNVAGPPIHPPDQPDRIRSGLADRQAIRWEYSRGLSCANRKLSIARADVNLIDCVDCELPALRG